MAEGWKRRVFLQGTAAAGAGIGAFTGAAPATAAPARGPGASGLRIVRTTVEYAGTLLGTDVERPRLTWEPAAPGHGVRQRAYRVQVVRDRARWDGRKVWDSGKVVSDRTVGVAYDGPALLPRTRYFWRVRVWDADGRASRWSEPSWWETTLSEGDWRARWIGADAPPRPPSFEGASWIWAPGATPSDAPEGPRWFRARLALPAGADVRRAVLVATADDDFTLYAGGRRALHAPQRQDGWRTGQVADVTALVRDTSSREVVLAALATNRGGARVNPGGLLVRLIVDTAEGQRRELVTGDDWRVSETEQPGWQQPDFDDSGWAGVAVLAPYGQGPWGSGVSVAEPEQPAPLLRRGFTVRKKISRARLYLSGLAYYEAHLNGRRVGRQVLDPGFTDYDETVLYAVHDVTGLLERGENALGVTLGRGFYGMTTPNVWNWHRAPWHGEPRLLAQLEIDHPDGSRTTVASDGEWRLTEGPTRSNSLYAGESYDARLAPGGWTLPGFDDSAWRPAGVQETPGGKLRAQPHDPIEIIETVRPEEISELRPGVYVVDMGRTMAGWTRLTVRGAAEGTVVRLVHGEQRTDDGSVEAGTGHVPGRFQTDEYVCAGRAEEVWEPSFSYKGFRYVQISGLPARPSPGQVLGRVVHTRVEEVSGFACSEPFYEWLDGAMRRTVLNNLHGIPTDTPMYEKNGWTGDAQVGAPVMAYAFGVHRLLSKWLGDLADSQTETGKVPVIVPSGGWGYREAAPSPEWTTVYPFVVREMYRVYGDERAAREHWTPWCATWTGNCPGWWTDWRSPRWATTCRPATAAIRPRTPGSRRRRICTAPCRTPRRRATCWARTGPRPVTGRPPGSSGTPSTRRSWPRRGTTARPGTPATGRRPTRCRWPSGSYRRAPVPPCSTVWSRTSRSAGTTSTRARWAPACCCGCCAPTAARTWRTPSRRSGRIRAGGTGRRTAPTPCGRCGRWSPAPATTISRARSCSGCTRTWPVCVPVTPGTAPSWCGPTPVRG